MESSFIFRRGIQFLFLLTNLSVTWVVGGETTSVAERENDPILSGCEVDYPPYCIVTQDKQADGFSVELLRATLKAMGREVVFKTGIWPEIKQDLIDGRLQVLPLVGRTPERELLFDFTFPYLTMHGAIVVRENNMNIHVPADLKGKHVAVLQGDNAEEYLRRANLGVVIVPLPSFETALRELSSGKHDAVIIQKLLAFQIIQNAHLLNLKVVGPPLKEFTQSFCFAVHKGNSDLLATINEGLAIVMAEGTFRKLYTKWFSALETLGDSKSRIVVGGDSNYPPYEFLDRNGQPAGCNVDLTRAIARQMGLAVDIRLDTWGEIRKGLERGEIDVTQGMFYSVERNKDFDFSPPYTIVQHVVVVRKESPELSYMEDLVGKAILVMSGDIMEDLAIKQGYKKQLVSVPSQEEALRLLASGKDDCALVAKVPAFYWIKKNGWRNLRVSKHAVLSAEYCYAASQSREKVLSQLTEGLTALKETGEYRKIQAKWLSPYETSGINFQTVMRYVLIATLPLLILLVGSFAWSRSLRRQVIGRTRELTTEITERKRAETELARHRDQLEELVRERTAELEKEITERKQAEQQIRAALEEKEVLLREIHHRVKNNLNTIASMLYFQAKTVEDQKALVAFQESQSRIHSMARVHEHLYRSANLAWVNMNAYLDDLMMDLRQTFEKSDVSIHIDAANAHLDIDQAIPCGLIVNEWVTNALKYAFPEGTSNPQKDLFVQLITQADQHILEVNDNGIGLPAGLDIEKSRSLGLRLVSMLTRQLKGRLTVDTAPGQGTKFTLTFPVETTGGSNGKN